MLHVDSVQIAYINEYYTRIVPMRTAMKEDVDSWSCRTPQLKSIRALLSCGTARCIFVCGSSSTGKRTIVEQALPPNTRLLLVDCVVQHTERLLYSAIAEKCVTPDFAQLVHQLRDSAPTAVVLLRAERLSSLSPASVTALLQLPRLSPKLSLVLLSRLPWPRFRDAAALEVGPPARVHFTPYTAAQLANALSTMYTAPAFANLYPGFVRYVVDLLSMVTTDLRELHAVCREMFPRYIAPLVGGAATDSNRANMPVALFNRVTADLKDVLQNMYRREFVVRNSKLVPAHVARAAQRRMDVHECTLIDPDLSVVSKFLLLAAYLATHNPPKYDLRYFSTERTRKPHKKRRKTAPVRHPFSVERLLAIFEALRDAHRNQPETTGSSAHAGALCTGGQVQIANLVRLGFLTAADAAGDPLADRKYRSNVTQAQAEEIGKHLHIQLKHYEHVEEL